MTSRSWTTFKKWPSAEKHRLEIKDRKEKERKNKQTNKQTKKKETKKETKKKQKRNKQTKEAKKI